MLRLYPSASQASRPLPRPLQAVLALWLILALVIAVRIYLRPTTHTAFPVLALASFHWWADEPVYANYRPDFDYFRYPPALAVFMTPFERLGPVAGGVLWSWLNLAMFGWGLWRFLHDLLPRDWSAWRRAMFLALATLGALRSLWNSQCNVLAVGLLLLGVAALVRGRWWPAAAWLGGSMLVKLTPVPIVLLLMALWPRQLVARIALVLAVGALAPFATRPPDSVLNQYRGMVAQMRDTSVERWLGFRDAWTVWMVARDLFQADAGPISLIAPMHSPTYRALQLLTAAGVLAWCLARKNRHGTPVYLTNMTLAMGSAWIVLFGPAVEHPTYAFLAPSMAWALLELGFRHGRKVILASALLILVFGWGGLTRPWQRDLPPLLAILPVGSALFTFWLVRFAQVREGDKEQASQALGGRERRRAA